MTERFTPESRDCFPYIESLSTRWGDNDVYGHVNNVVYYAWFDSAVNRMLIERGLAPEPAHAAAAADLPIGLVVATQCQYFESVAYPSPVEIGLRVEAIGNASVTYRLAVFTPGTAMSLAAARYTHVYVDRETRRPTPLSPAHRQVFEALQGGDTR
jgi:acyl-CoA thioester hydrolase